MEASLGDVASLPLELAECASTGDKSNRRCELPLDILMVFVSNQVTARAKTTITAFNNQTKGAER